ncbi:unnamed protein product [Calicophoron daubneyi]|uniref:Conserved oligomeric Golgi complex subunit 7 n=1 Tax=Calicophoron daubneyi TaxID=300641 RepID=A0AAV2SXL2_CALDB
MNRLDFLCSCDWCMLRQLAVCQPAELQNALHRLAHPSASNATVDPDQKPSARKVPALESTLEFNPTALHRANLSACRSAVSVVRRVALAPLSALLGSVPGLPVWSSNPESGENTLPDLAYLPQDYITKAISRIGQYLLALPEHLEPYMSAGVAPAPYSLLSNKVELFTESDPGRGLAECLHLGDPEITNLPSLSGKVVEDTNTETGSKSSSQRKRMPSFTLTARRSMSTGIGQPDSDTATSAAFGWLESLVSGSASDLLLTTLLRIGTVERPKTKDQNSKRRHRPQHRTSDQGSESESELEEQAALTEHGAKQLEVDLGYFHNVLDDLGLTFSGSLQAFYELIRCPPDEFATVSAERPPRIVNAVARLRGL